MDWASSRTVMLPFPKAGEWKPSDIDASECLAARILPGGVVVTVRRGVHDNAIAPSCQLFCGIGDVLSDARGVGNVDLADDEDGRRCHGSMPPLRRVRVMPLQISSSRPSRSHPWTSDPSNHLPSCHTLGDALGPGLHVPALGLKPSPGIGWLPLVKVEMEERCAVLALYFATNSS